MKLIFDQNISFRIIDLVQPNFPGSVHVKQIELQHASDRSIWNFARLNGYQIVTFDADFYDFVTL